MNLSSRSLKTTLARSALQQTSHMLSVSSTTRTVVINAFQIVYIFFRAISDVQLPIMFIFKSSIARQRINIRHYVLLSNSTLDNQLSSSMHICAGASLLHVQFYLRFLYTRFPHLRCLHADSISREIHMMYFTRCFHYLRSPYPTK